MYKIASVFMKFVAGLTILAGLFSAGAGLTLIGDIYIKMFIILLSGCTVASGVIVFITSKFEESD